MKTKNVAIKNFPVELWNQAGIKSKIEGITMAEYIANLLIEDIGEDYFEKKDKNKGNKNGKN
jgi:hypothetical protein